MTYREIEYTFNERRTWDGVKVDSFNCNDKVLLSNVDTTSFGTTTLDEMHELIDYYLDNSERHIKLKELNDRACEEFFNDNPNTPKD